MMNDDQKFKRQWQKQGPGLPKAPASLSAGFWARSRPQAQRTSAWAWRSAMAGLLLGLGFWLGRRQGGTEVHFRLAAPRATQVDLKGSFNGWQPLAMRRNGEEWVLDLRLEPGRHRYAFVLNGRRSLPDPDGGDAELSADGEVQSVLYLPKTHTL